MAKQNISISIVDDHPMVLEGLQIMLKPQEDIYIISTYLTGQQLIEGLKNHKPDVLLLDIKLPDISGEELIEQIVEKFPNVKILVISYLDSLYYVKTMIRKGALGYILKTCSKDVLVEAIHSVAQGEKYIEDHVKEILVSYALASKKELRNTAILTEREKEILQLISSDLTSRQIAKKLFLSLKTIEFHRSNLLLKLKVKNAASMIKKAMEMNLLE